LRNLKKLNRGDLREIKGGGGQQICDIDRKDLPVKSRQVILACLGGPGGPGNPGEPVGYCPGSQSYIPCDQICPNGLQPLCVL
jgi:hypothetical protein